MSKSHAQERAARLVAEETVAAWFNIAAPVVDAAGKKAADVFVYGTIGGSWWDDDSPSAASFAKDLAALDVETINLYVNSPGGSVYDGIAMRNTLKRHPANVIAHVDGIAASAASFLITGGDEVVMGQNTELMIHDALTIAMGNAADMRSVADELDNVSDNIASMYASKAGGDVADWRALMIAETWYTADEAVAAGLADRVADTAATDVEDRFDLSVFAHAGRSEAPAPAALADVAAYRATFTDSATFLERVAASAGKVRATRPAEPGSTTPSNTDTKGVDQMADLKNAIAARLGLPEADVADMSDETILAALDETLNEQADTPAVVVPEGTEVVDSTVLATLRDQASRGAQAFENQESARREGIVDAALRAGKITAVSRDKWLANLEKNEAGTVDLLDSMSEGTVLPTRELGTVGGADTSNDDDRDYINVFGEAPSNTNTQKEA